jgi:flagellar motility protein MotE (MotC chaperone)/sporulation protein YlmC with PRC-barrel domain/predicted transcriptional regulator
VTVGTRIYVARLAGVAVFDPNGDPVGRVRDVVVMFRPDRLPPRVLGLLVELQHRRRIFVPIGRVTSIEAGAVVLASGSVNLRRFEQRPGEALVLGTLLDRTATIRETDAKVTVIDAAMEQTRTKDWVLTRLAVRDLGSRLARRRGQVRQVEWEELDGLGPTAEAEQGADALLNVLSTSRPADIANMLQDLDPKRRHEIAAALDDERLADVLEELPEDTQVKILASLADERAADILEEMDPDDAADLLAELAPSERERLFQLMEPGEAAPVRRLLRYGDDTAGGLMTSEPIILAPDATIAEALARVRNPDITPALATQVYVCRPPSETPTGRYLGVAHVQRLLREPPSALVSGVVDDDLEPVRPETELSELTRYLATYDLVAAAVVDESDRLVGAVTVDDVLDHLLPEDWRERDIDG